MGWCVVDVERGQVVEDAIVSPYFACRVMWTLVAHELKNGRKPNYRIEPPVDLVDWEDCDMPPWAAEQLQRITSLDVTTVGMDCPADPR